MISNHLFSPRISILLRHFSTRCSSQSINASSASASSSSSSSSSTPPPLPTRNRLEGVKKMMNIVNNELDGKAWDSLWKQNITPWLQSTSAPALLELIEANVLPTGRVLVPGCGHGNDVFALAEKDKRIVTGLDISPTVVELCEKTRTERQIPSSIAKFEVADFFQYKPAQPFDLIYDYTFLGALPPSLHQDWANQMKNLLSPKGELVTLIFPVDGHEGGPPYAMSPEQVVNLLTPLGFKAIHLRPVTNAHKGRLGIEWLGRWKLNY